jgi:hypothetical protein
LVRQTELLRELGVKPGKRIAEGLLDPGHDAESLAEAPTASGAPAQTLGGA